MPGIRFHDLGHACATLLLTKGVHQNIVSDMFGYSSIATMMDTCAQVIPGLGEETAAVTGGVP